MMRFTLLTLLVTLLFVVGKALDTSGTAKYQRDLQDDDNVLARAFRCDSNLDEITSNEIIEKGTTIRVCIATHLRARLQGIQLTKVANFHFLKEDEEERPYVEEALIENGVETSKKTQLNCEPGSDLCFFDSTPRDDFFLLGGTVWAIGNVMLQQNQYENLMLDTDFDQGNNRMLMENNRRELINTMTTVEMKFYVGDGLDGSSRLFRDFRENWDNISNYKKALYILCFILLLLILLAGLSAGIYYWAGCCCCCSRSHTTEEDEDEENAVPLTKDDQSGTFVGDEDSENAWPSFKKANSEAGEKKPNQVYVRNHHDDSEEGSSARLKPTFDSGSNRSQSRKLPRGTLGSIGSPRESSRAQSQYRFPRRSSAAPVGRPTSTRTNPLPKMHLSTGSLGSIGSPRESNIGRSPYRFSRRSAAAPISNGAIPSPRKKLPTGTLGSIGSPRESNTARSPYRFPRWSAAPSMGRPSSTRAIPSPPRKVPTKTGTASERKQYRLPRSSGMGNNAGARETRSASPVRTRPQSFNSGARPPSRASPNRGHRPTTPRRNGSNATADGLHQRTGMDLHHHHHRRAKEAATLRWLDAKKARVNPAPQSAPQDRMGKMPLSVKNNDADRRRDARMARKVRFESTTTTTSNPAPTERLRTNPRVVD